MRISSWCRVAVVITFGVTAGCSASAADKSGTHSGNVVLTMASTPAGPADDPVIEYFTRRVAALSRGSLTISPRYSWGSFAPDAEQQAIRAAAKGDTDLGWAGSRAFDVLGVRSLEPLTAPFLVDNYALLQKVLTSPLGAQMLAGADQAHVTPLGMAADSLRVPISVHRPLLTPSDWRGNGIGTYPSEVQSETVRALGGLPVQAFGPFRTEALTTRRIGGFEFDLRRYNQLGLVPLARYVVPNEVLWPMVDVVFANPGALERLTTQQRSWLKQAMTDTMTHAVDIARDTVPAATTACTAGARFVPATTHQLADLRKSVDGVYAAIGHDLQLARVIAQIEQMKRQTTPEPIQVPHQCLRSH